MAKAAAASKEPSRKKFIVAGVAVGAVLIALNYGLDLPALHDRAKEMNAGLVLLALAVLPLVGFPVTVLHAMTGARFGLPLGMALVGGSIALQLVVSYAVVRAAPKFFARRFDWLRQRLPPATHHSLTLFTLFLPGAPYFAKNYVLPVVGVPFRIFFAYGFPIHFARSVIGVIFGEWSGDMTPGRIAVFVLYLLTVAVVCGLAFRRLRGQVQSRPPAANGRKRPA